MWTGKKYKPLFNTRAVLTPDEEAASEARFIELVQNAGLDQLKVIGDLVLLQFIPNEEARGGARLRELVEDENAARMQFLGRMENFAPGSVSDRDAFVSRLGTLAEDTVQILGAWVVNAEAVSDLRQNHRLIQMLGCEYDRRAASMQAIREAAAEEYAVFEKKLENGLPAERDIVVLAPLHLKKMTPQTA